MSVKYRLVERKNLGKDKEEKPKKLYAQPVYSDLVGFKELLGEIAESGIPSNQVKGVTDRMNHLISKHLAAGRRVQFGEFGNFRYGIGSSGADTEDDFTNSQIRTPRIIFSPGSDLRAARKVATFEKKEAVPAAPEESKPEERPGEL
ncbi:HU family DNA-binding protein [uncultured Parabacteroides sp.]|uniref:HU family DNA-binding protein n=1 Tax=uncultured Parabacteroides sp. TaxID=512312 RepID=UPI0025E649D3|nr:HU family DNA-binding protein [uncultured Parabacteroides sp.]MCD7851388.1 DNA-binding protein [Parabacteroides sp.]